jgi:PST family polysaccharide transporter
MLTFPLMAGLYVLREPFVLVVLGNKWLPVADVLQWLAPVGLIQSLTTTMGMIYMVTGRTVVMFRWGFISSVLTISAMAVGIPYGFLGVAKCYAAINALIFWPTCYFALSQINLGLWAFLKGLFPTFCAAVGMGLAVALLVHVMGPGTLPVYVLASGVLFGMLAYALLSALLVPDFRQMSVALLKRVRGAK